MCVRVLAVRPLGVAVRVAVCGDNARDDRTIVAIERSAAVPAARAGRVIRGFSVFNACFFALCAVDVRDRRRRAIARGPVRIARSRRTPSRLTSRDRSSEYVLFMTIRDSSVSRGTRRARGTRTGPSRARPRATKIARASGRGATRASPRASPRVGGPRDVPAYDSECPNVSTNRMGKQ